MKNFKEYLKEYLSEAKGNTYELYHDSLSSAVDSMEKFAKERGYELDPEEMADVIGFGPKKPSGGKTNRYTLSLTKNGKKQKKAIHFQVYNRETNRNTFELNTYIK